jgi:hypothetical protein
MEDGRHGREEGRTFPDIPTVEETTERFAPCTKFEGEAPVEKGRNDGERERLSQEGHTRRRQKTREEMPIEESSRKEMETGREEEHAHRGNERKKGRRK